MSTCKQCEKEMKWPLCEKFTPGAFQKKKCADCFHAQSDHGGESAAGAAEEEKPRPKISIPKPKPKAKEAPKPKKKEEARPKASYSSTGGGAKVDFEVRDKMQCAVVRDGSIVLEERDTPKPGKEEVLVRVRAAGINRADLLQVAGKYPPPAGASDVLGLEVSGYVVKAGYAMKDFWGNGDRVAGLVAGGAYAEYCVVHGDALIELPEKATYEEGAALPEAFLTAYQALFFVGELERLCADGKPNILIHGGSGGVGSALIQLAKSKGRVFCTAGSDEKIAHCKDLGADVVVNYKEGDWAQAIKDKAGDGINLLIDVVGADYWNQNLSVMARDGMMVLLGFMTGADVQGTAHLRDILAKRLTVRGTTLRSRDATYKAVLTQAFLDAYGDQLARQKLKVPVAASFPLADAAKSHDDMKRGAHKGKIVLVVATDEQDEAKK